MDHAERPRLRTGWIDEQISRATRRGLFDDLPGAGRPLPHLDEVRDPAWWGKTLLRRERLSVLPPSLRIRFETERALDALARLRDEEEVRRALHALNERIARVNARADKGPPTTQGPVDVEERVAAWRARRESGA